MIRGRRLALLVAFVVPLAAAPGFAGGSSTGSPTPTPVSAHDRLVQEIATLNQFLLNPRIPADNRRRLTESRNRLEARRLKMEAAAARSAASPR